MGVWGNMWKRIATGREKTKGVVKRGRGVMISGGFATSGVPLHCAIGTH